MSFDFFDSNGDAPPMKLFIAVGFGVVLFTVIVVACLIFRRDECPDNNANYLVMRETRVEVSEHHRDHHPSSKQRRLLHNPFYSLAHELGGDVNVAAEPTATARRCLTERQQLLPESLGSNLWWILPVSCIAQILWILLGVYLKRTCTKVVRGRKSETKAIPRR